MIKYHVYSYGENYMKQPNKNILKVIHNAGFFSNMTIRLQELFIYMKQHNCFPDDIDSSSQFQFFKSLSHEDVSKYYIKHNDIEIPCVIPDIAKHDCMSIQFDDYSKIDFENITPILNKWFDLGDMVKNKKEQLKEKYNLNEYIGVFYRGNDKRIEMELPTYDNFINKIKEIRAIEPNLPIYTLPDECSFLKELKNNFDNVIAFEETPCIDKPDSCMMFEMPINKRSEYGAIYNASVSLMSESKYLITHSGNGGLWAALYRGNSNNLYQIHNNKWYDELRNITKGIN